MAIVFEPPDGLADWETGLHRGFDSPMPERSSMAADIFTYAVEFSLGEYGQRRRTLVAIGGTSTHETTFGDIPKIIAVSNGLGQHPELVVVLWADLVKQEPSAL